MTYSKRASISKLYRLAGLLPIMVVSFFIYSIFNAQSLKAQGNAQNPTGKLKAFDGYYQFQDNKDAFLKITASGNKLVLKQLWDGREFVFDQVSSLEFYCKAQSFPLKFKDSASIIAQVLAFNKDVWDKIKDYKPVVKKEVQLTPQQLKALEGKYQMKGGDDDDFLQITTSGNSIILKQLWDGQEITFVPESALEFFCKDRLFPLKFSKGEDGTITQVLAFNRDVWLRVK